MISIILRNFWESGCKKKKDTTEKMIGTSHEHVNKDNIVPRWHKVKQVTPKFIYHATESHSIAVPCHPMTGEERREWI